MRVPKWRRRLRRVLRDLHIERKTYKGMERYRDVAVAFVSRFDDGATTSPGIALDIAPPLPKVNG